MYNIIFLNYLPNESLKRIGCYKLSNLIPYLEISSRFKYFLIVDIINFCSKTISFFREDFYICVNTNEK